MGIEPFNLPALVLLSALLLGAGFSCNRSTEVQPEDPEAKFVVFPEKPEKGEEVNFDASSSTGGQGREIVEYTWQLGDQTRTTTDPTISHTFRQAGKYEITLSVTDDIGETDSVTGSLSVKPSVEIRPDFQYEISDLSDPLTVRFDASDSETSTGEIVEYEWIFRGHLGPPQSDPELTWTFHNPGEKRIYLRAITEFSLFGGETQRDSKMIERKINLFDPAGPGRIGSNVLQPETGETVEFAAVPSEPEAWKILNYEWKVDGAVVSSGPDQKTLERTFNEEGRHEVTLTVKRRLRDLGDPYPAPDEVDEALEEHREHLALQVLAPGSWPGYSRTIRNTGAVTEMSGNISNPIPYKVGHYEEASIIFTSPVVADMDNDGSRSIFIADKDEQILKFSDTRAPEGERVASYNSGLYDPPPSLADLTGDDQKELIVNIGGAVQVFPHDENTNSYLWYRAGGGGPPVVADLTGNGSFEVVVLTFGDEALVYDGETGDTIWSYSFGTSGKSSPAVGDLTGNGEPEVVLSGSYVVALAGIGKEFPEQEDREVWSNRSYGSGESPVLKDLTGDGLLDVIIVDGGGTVRAFRGTSGEELWSSKTMGIITGSPAVADITGNDKQEVVVATNDNVGNNAVYLIAGEDQQQYEGGEEIWSTPVEQEVARSPVVADITGDGNMDIIVVTRSYVYAIDHKGGLHWAHYLRQTWIGEGGNGSFSPAVADLTGDGELEIVYTGPRHSFPVGVISGE